MCPPQLDKSSGDFCCSNLLLPLQHEIRQTGRKLLSMQITKDWTSQGHKQPSISEWCCLLHTASWCGMWSSQESWQLPEIFFHIVLTEPNVWFVHLQTSISCCSFLGTVEVCFNSRVCCSSRCADCSQRLSTPLTHSVVRLMEAWTALTNLEIFAHFPGVCRSIGPPFPVASQGWSLRSKLAILSAANTCFSGCCQGLH